MQALLTITIFALLATGCKPKPILTPNTNKHQIQKTDPSILYVSVFSNGKVELNGWSLPLDAAIDRINDLSGTKTQARYYYKTQQNKTPPVAGKILTTLLDAQLDIQFTSNPQSPVLTDNTVQSATNMICKPIRGCGPIGVLFSPTRRPKNLFAPPIFPPDSLQHYHIIVNEHGRQYPVILAQYGKSWLGCVGTNIQEPWYFKPVTGFSPKDCLALIRSQHKLTGNFIKGKRRR